MPSLSCAKRMSATTRCWSASISGGDSKMIPNGWKSCSSSTPKPRRSLNAKNEDESLTLMSAEKSVPSVSVTYAQTGASTKSNELGMRAMQERAYEKRGEQYLLIKSPPASGKSRALMFIALDKLHNQGLGAGDYHRAREIHRIELCNDEPLSKFGFWADWEVEPHGTLQRAGLGQAARSFGRRVPEKRRTCRSSALTPPSAMRSISSALRRSTSADCG